MTHDKQPSRRLLRTTALAFTVILGATACGGGGSDAASPEAAAEAASAPVATTRGFNGTAYTKTKRTIWYDGKNYGFLRDLSQGLVDQCNEFRKSYNVGPDVPSEATMASQDVFIEERYFDTNKALTVSTHSALSVPGTQRWLDEFTVSAANGGRPAAPPDCTAQLTEFRDGTLWRDGVMYELRYDTQKAFGSRGANTLTPRTLLSAETFANLPFDKQFGKTCREVTGVNTLSPESHTCIWDLFPYVSYLNWPFAFSGRVRHGPTPTLYDTIELLSVEQGRAIPSEVFEIPKGFTTIVRD